MPGEITQVLAKMKYKNGLIMFDEYEKISPQMAATLLHVTDPEQNKDFIDDYLRFEQDLSSIFWGFCMNKKPDDLALSDRMFILYVDGYNFNEKVKIVTDYALPERVRELELADNSITMSEDVAKHFVTTFSDDSDKGVRPLKHNIIDLCNKIVFLVTHQDDNGDLPFDTTFNLKKKLSYPVIVTKKMINMLEKGKSKQSESLTHMYM